MSITRPPPIYALLREPPAYIWTLLSFAIFVWLSFHFPRGSELNGSLAHYAFLELAVVAAGGTIVLIRRRYRHSDPLSIIPTQTADPDTLDPVTAGVLGLERLLEEGMSVSDKKETLATLSSIYYRLGQTAYLTGLSTDPLEHHQVLEAISAFPVGDARTNTVISAYKRGFISAQGGW